MHPLLLPLCMCCLVACNSPRTTEELKDQTFDAVMVGDYETAALTVNKIYGSHLANEAAKPGGSPESAAEYKDKHVLLWHTERGSIDYLGGDVGRSERHFQAAHDVAKQFRSDSLTEAALSWVANDNAKSYDGTAQEHAYIEYYRALNAIVQAQHLAGVHIPLVPGEAVGTEPPGWAPMQLLTDPGKAEKAYERAIIYGRGLNNDVLKWTEDVAGTERYRDDGFARLFAGITAMIQPQPMDSDRQFAVHALGKSVAAYQAHQQQLQGQKSFRYEVQGLPRLARALQLRSLAVYDPERLGKELKKLKLTETAAAEQGLLQPPNTGSVIVLHDRGFAARKQILDIRIASVYADKGKSASGNRKSWGAFTVWASGPDTSALDTLVLLPLPGDLGRVVSPGGAAIMGFAIPVHDPDKPAPPPARIAHQPVAAGSAGGQIQMERVADVDAAARAMLKDQQAGTLTKTLTRAIAKQLAVGAAAYSTKKSGRGHGHTDWGALLVNLVGSTLMTITEVADTRCWTLMPNTIEATLLDLPAGEHDIDLIPVAGERVRLGRVVVRPGGLVVLPVRTLVDPPYSPDGKKDRLKAAGKPQAKAEQPQSKRRVSTSVGLSVTR